MTERRRGWDEWGASPPYEPHEQRGVARAFEGWDEWAAACVKTIKGRMLTTTMKKKVTLLMMMLTRVGMRMVTRMVMRMVMRMGARMLVKTVTMMVMLMTARGLYIMLCGDGDEGQGARHLSARAPSRSFSLIESTHASIPRMNNMRVAKEMLDSPHMLMRCKLCSRPAR